MNPSFSGHQCHGVNGTPPCSFYHRARCFADLASKLLSIRTWRKARRRLYRDFLARERRQDLPTSPRESSGHQGTMNAIVESTTADFGGLRQKKLRTASHFYFYTWYTACSQMKYLNIVARRMHACMNLYCGRDATALKSEMYKLGRSKLKSEHVKINS